MKQKIDPVIEERQYLRRQMKRNVERYARNIALDDYSPNLHLDIKAKLIKDILEWYENAFRSEP